MNLIIDEGNSAFKLAVFDQGKIIDWQWFVPFEREQMHDFIVEHLRSIKHAIISSVVDKGMDLSRYNFTQLELSHTTPVPIHNLYKTRETLGKDRLANVVGAWALNRNQNSLVIDCGTCVKYDFINYDGEYFGGSISPGLNMRYKALHEYTDKLPKVEPAEYDSFYGTDTRTSIITGVQQAMKYEIKGNIERYRKEFGSLTIFMTGGDAKFFDKAFEIDIFANSELTLVGLNEILSFNVQNQ